MRVLSQLKQQLQKLADPKRAQSSLWFFKTGPGEYGEGDKFLGVGVISLRKLAKQYKDLSLLNVLLLLKSPWHEYRQIALLILMLKYKKGDSKIKTQVFNAYIKNTQYINNWDLVDITAPRIVGNHLVDKSRQLLYNFARSQDLWKKRIAIISTFAFIKNNDFTDALKLAEILLNDQHDLIHKAVGWMLREVGNRDRATEEQFLKKYYKLMPRTMLRYAIEKFPEQKRKFYMSKVHHPRLPSPAAQDQWRAGLAPPQRGGEAISISPPARGGVRGGGRGVGI